MDKNSQGIECMMEHKYEEAARIFNEVIEENPSDPLGYINFGNLLMHMKDYVRAERFFLKGIELDRNVGTAYYALGNLYFEQAIFEKAGQYFHKALELGLEEADVYYMLGLTFQKQEQFKLSLPFFLRASELQSDDEEILFQYGLALAQSNDLNDAKSILEHVLELNEMHADAHYNLGVINLFNEDVKVALNHFNEALNSQPDHLLAANGKKNVEALLKAKD